MNKQKKDNKMKSTLKKYKQNLKIDFDFIYSYKTRVATFNHNEQTIHPLGWWSVTTSKHINYVADEYAYKVVR